jgi:hypothetical protein
MAAKTGRGKGTDVTTKQSGKARRPRGKTFRVNVGAPGQLELQFPLSALDARTRTHIRCKARQLCLRPPFMPSDQRDIEQELTLDLMVRAARFNSTKGKWTTFFSRVIRNKISHLIEARLAKIRDYHLDSGSVNELVVDESGDMVERLCLLEDTGATPSLDNKGFDLAFDVAEAVSCLPEDLKSFCIAYQHCSLADVARSRGVKRESLYPLVRAVRAHFMAAGLRAYLGNNGCRDP